MKKFVGICLVALSSIAFADSQVLLTPSATSTKGQSSVSLDLVSSTNFKGFQFEINFAGAKSVNLASCLASLPKNLTVSCKQIRDKVKVFVVDLAAAGTDVKAGNLQIGVISYTGEASLEVTNLVVANKEGTYIESSARIAK